MKQCCHACNLAGWVKTMAQTLKINTSTLLALTVLAVMLQYSVRTLVADALFTMVPRILDDKNTEALDVLDLSEETLPAYRMAIERIRQASLWDPGNSLYVKAQADLYVRLGTLAQVVRQVEENLLEGAILSNEEQGRANGLIIQAINLEPSNPDYHLARYANRLSSLQAGKPVRFLTDDLEKAVQLYPNSSPLRYQVAAQYLILGEKNKALKHAKALAARDDSYRLPDAISRDVLIERRSRAYLSFLAQSYLAKAFEIAWRASGNEPALIRAMIPQGQEALDTANLFLESKTINVHDGTK